MTQQLRAIDAQERFFPQGEVISDRFELGELIGKGPFGEVYRATDDLIETEVALKIFDSALIEDPRHQEQFLKTVRTARTMTQSNVVRIHGSGVHKEHAWVSMQALEGLSLRKVLKMRRQKDEAFSLTELEPIVSQITLAIQHVNREFPVGDLKPENVHFLPDLVKITDHYLYAAVDAEAFAERLSESNYLAPELHTPSDEIDARCDVYSLGIIIGEMMFGPDYTPGSISADSPEMAGVDALCRRATAFDPAERYPSVEALSEDFATLVDTGALLHGSRQETPGLSSLSEPSTPPPAPAGPPSGDPLLEETPRDIGEPIEDDIATREYEREEHGPELGDLLETNEVRREQLPPPPERSAGKDSDDDEKAAAGPKPPAAASKKPSKKKDSEDAKPHYVILGLIALIAVIGGIFWLTGDKKESKHVEIGDPSSEVAAGGAEASEATKETAKASKEDTMATAREEAGQVLLAARGEAMSAAKKAGAQVEKGEPADAGAAEDAAGGDDATAQAAASSEADKSEGGRAGQTQKAKGAKAKASAESSKKEEKAKNAGTNCKGGMVLVKSKKRGNYCIDAYEYPARGVPPKTNVSWFQAKQLCESKGKRLCTLSEWRGACGGKYPYGSKWDADKCNTVDEDEFERSLAPAGKFRKCRSWTGARDMVGNAHEWVAEQRIAGGGYDSGPEVASCRYSSAKAPGSSAPYIGFRCCADAQ